MKYFFSLFLISIYICSFGQNDPLFNAFKQGTTAGGGNCASIAIIKASIGTFGVGSIFLSKTYNNVTNTTTFTLRSGSTVTITDEELSTAIVKADFVQKNVDNNSLEIKNYADTCFAVMCKNLQNMHGWTFAGAVDSLNKGYYTPDIDVLLGVKFQKVKPHRASKIKQYKNIVIYNTYHAVFASGGYYDEAWNSSGVNKIGKLKIKRAGIKCGFIFCGIRGAFIVT